ncbi:MAG: 4-alpha-glucanotransferase [Candidatus Omnitrophica bacterium]|nr:4-alpha-glucanotransferase [Candidatus Omnitrophota bacterium]
MLKKRGSGILLHITSLPSIHGIGDLGPAAYRFADFLAASKQSYWQVLPLNPTNPACGNSPYSSTSAFAGNPLLISPELLAAQGLLTDKDMPPVPDFPGNRCDFDSVIAYKGKLFQAAFKHFKEQTVLKEEYKAFCTAHADWLNGFAVFQVLRDHFKGEMWGNWKKKFRNKEAKDISEIKKDARDEIEFVKFLQFVFFKQWFALKRYCNDRGINIIGDIPIYVSYDSADVWAHESLFKLDTKKEPEFMAGVPPDYFSATGQLWGNPVYNWEAVKATGFKWWIRRMEHNLALFDIVRIDHFRGLVAYWEVPKGETTAVNGKWVEAPVHDFFNALLEHFHHKLPVIAEDLGIITEDVKKVQQHFKFPGMKILVFAFGEDNPFHPYLPHSYDKNWVVYTGTHDNNTVRGWFDKEASPDEKRRLFRYFGRELTADQINWDLIRLALMSVADLTVFPLQDIIGLGIEGRMNTPSVPTGNWSWRFKQDQVTQQITDRLAEMTWVYGRI